MGVSVGTSVETSMGESVSDGSGVISVGITVLVSEGVGVSVGTSVDVSVSVGVNISVGIGVSVSTGVSVTEGVAVCSTRNVDVARSIGADQVIDYTKEDFTQNGQQYNLILAVNGYHPISAYRRALSPRGVYVAAGGSLTQVSQSLLLGPMMSKTGGQRLRFMGIARINQEDLVFLKDLIEAGKVVPVIDRSYPLSEAAEAARYLGEGHARGKVILTIE